MALADPGDGHSRSDDSKGDDSIGGIVRRAFGMDDGNDPKASQPGQQRQTRGGNGRQEQGSGEKEPPTTGTSPTGEATVKESSTAELPRPSCEKAPCPDPTDPAPPGRPSPRAPQSSGGGGGAIVQLPRYKPPSVPDMQLPGELQPSQPGGAGPAVLDAGAGAVAAPAGVAAPIALPVIVVPPPLGLGAGPGGAGSAGASAGPPQAIPRAVTAEPPAGRVPLPANVGSNAPASNASYRIGYTEYLRTAGLPQVAALAVPGLVGIMVLTGAGGLVGYRQAKAGHAVRVADTARFMR